ncbi:MAG: C39 family peptidase [Trichodesmium sp.]
MKRLNVPYFPQAINNINPVSSSVIACLAMCLKYRGIYKGDDDSQFQNRIYQRAEMFGLSDFSPESTERLCETYKVAANFTCRGSVAEIKESIDKRKPVIIHTFFTELGHCIVITGYNDGFFFVHIPGGELLEKTNEPGWYFKSSISGDIRGENLCYSELLIKSLCSAKDYREAKSLYQEQGQLVGKDVDNLNFLAVG